MCRNATWGCGWWSGQCWLTVGLVVLVILKVLPNLNKSLILSPWSVLPPTKVAAVKAIGTRMRHLLSRPSFDEEILLVPIYLP